MQGINLNGKDKAQETDVKPKSRKSSIESRIESADIFMEDLKVAEKFKADVFWPWFLPNKIEDTTRNELKIKCC